MTVDKIICDDPEVAETLNNFFDNAIELIKHLINVNENCDPMGVILRNYSNHLSILNVLRVIEKSSFSFHVISLADIDLEINKLT